MADATKIEWTNDVHSIYSELWDQFRAQFARPQNESDYRKQTIGRTLRAVSNGAANAVSGMNETPLESTMLEAMALRQSVLNVKLLNNGGLINRALGQRSEGISSKRATATKNRRDGALTISSRSGCYQTRMIFPAAIALIAERTSVTSTITI